MLNLDELLGSNSADQLADIVNLRVLHESLSPQEHLVAIAGLDEAALLHCFDVEWRVSVYHQSVVLRVVLVQMHVFVTHVDLEPATKNTCPTTALNTLIIHFIKLLHELVSPVLKASKTLLILNVLFHNILVFSARHIEPLVNQRDFIAVVVHHLRHHVHGVGHIEDLLPDHLRVQEYLLLLLLLVVCVSLEVHAALTEMFYGFLQLLESHLGVKLDFISDDLLFVGVYLRILVILLEEV